MSTTSTKLLLLMRNGISAPDAPTGLTATQDGANVDLAWTDNANSETEYRIYRSADGVTYALLDTIAADLEVYTDTAPGNGIWYYKVAAYNAAGEAASDAVSVTLANLWFTANQATITPAITLSGGAPAPDWLVTETGGGTFTYNTAAFTHNRVTAGALTVELRNSPTLVAFLTQIDFNGDGITSSLATMNVTQFVNLDILRLYSNALTGAVPTTIGSLVKLTVLRVDTNQLTGNLPAEMQNLVLLADFRAFSNMLSGVAAGALRLPAAVLIRIDSNGMLTAAVNAALFDAYTGSLTRTAVAGTINIAGTNQAPSGTFQAATSCPVTAATPGKEIAHELLNDTCGAFANHWATVTITA